VIIDRAESGDALRLIAQPNLQPPIPHPRPVVLAVDDNPHLAAWLERLLADAHVTPLIAATAHEAREIAGRQRIDVALVDLLTSEGDGLWLAFELLRLWPQLQVVITAGTELSPDEAALCDRQDFPVLRKPFLASDVLGVIQARLLHSSAVGS
jgi:DNA-binding NtrC family response regulator